MNRDDIIRLMNEAAETIDHTNLLPFFERFAALVAAYEREACAKVCIDQTMIQPDGNYNDGCFACYYTIRKRGKV
jgi:hypothetical protein